jgi:hypothetical protein
MRRNYAIVAAVAVLILLNCASVFPVYSRSNSPAKLLDAVVKAHGADKALACASVVLDLDVITDPTTGQAFGGHIFVQSERFRLEYLLSPGFTYRMGFDGSQAWLIGSPKAAGPKKLDLLQVGLFKFYALAFSTRWLGYLRTHADALKYGGKESYRGFNTEVLQANVDTIGNADFLVDASSHLLKAIRFIFPGESQPHYEIIYQSYTDQNGVQVPQTIDIYRNELHYRRYRVKEARLCEKIDDSIFAPDLKPVGR